MLNRSLEEEISIVFGDEMESKKELQTEAGTPS